MEERRVALIVDCTNTNFITTYTPREEGGWQQKNREGWLEDGMIRTIGLPPA